MEILDILKETESFMEGHFELSSGLHTYKYCQCAKMLQNPAYAAIAGQKIAAMYDRDEVDTVLGPALGGVIIGYEVARALGKPFIFTERKEGIMALRRGFNINEGEKVLIIEDVITTAKSVKENIGILHQYGAKVSGIACIIDRSKGKSGIDFKSLTKDDPILFNPDECPLCREGVPLYYLGSKTNNLFNLY